VPPRLKHVATLPCEILMSEKNRTWSIQRDLPYFARYCSNGIYVWWNLWLWLYYKLLLSLLWKNF